MRPSLEARASAPSKLNLRLVQVVWARSIARETPSLNRDVALKVLPELFAADPDRLARFEREAQVLASLNHPNIAAIYGIEESAEAGTVYARSSWNSSTGRRLSERIARGPMPLDEALPIARQIADALEAAHEHGIVHRDLEARQHQDCAPTAR